MKVVILAGGYGSRISEESQFRPKPMITIGGRPMLWHIMKYYASFGFDDFIICAGYKQELIKEYFAEYFLRTTDVTFDFTSGTDVTEFHRTHVDRWRVTVADTGLKTMTSGRIRRISKYLDDEPFLMTYGDGLSDIDQRALIDFHETHGGTVTISAVRMTQRFGVVDMDAEGNVLAFREKSNDDGGYINGGFMVVEPSIFDEPLLDGDDLAKVTLESLSRHGKLTAYRHDGYWDAMDTVRDRERIEHLWYANRAPWKLW